MTNSGVTFKDLVDFVLANKTNKTFIGFSDEQIVNKLHAGLYHQNLFYHTDLNGRIVGMILAERDDKKRVLFITENLAMSIQTLKKFAKKAHETWPTYTLEWLKHGIHKTHNTNKVYKKLGIL